MKARQTLPRCGAKRRSDGGACAAIAMSNGRCYLHGGSTPSGKDWHRTQLKNRSKSTKKLDRKLKDLARRRAKQAARVAAMTPEERARYDAWHAARKPGGPEVRRVAAETREFRDMLAERANATPVETAVAKAIREAIEALERRAARLKPPKAGPDAEDVFS
ncbi:MAG: hypothetical protein U1E06_07910 [Tabrizicola sp.]|nr:hypothetical protein [Tabrizicola sp.]MDZ4066767.1 hypothetical protein [Tabrizicola sp.]